MHSTNPANGELIATYDEQTWDQVAARLEAVKKAFSTWSDTGFEHRARCLNAAADVLDRRREELARLMALEMGKPIRQGRAEIQKCAAVSRYYAAHGAQFLAPQPVETEAHKSYVAFRPLGVVLAIMPWNFPFWQVFRFAVPALMAGNTAVLKHAANVPGCALAVEEVFHEAGFPQDSFRTLLIGSEVVERVIEAPEIAAVTLTGSTRAGRAVAARAGACLKKTVLELGGSDPYVVLEDAEVEEAAAACAESRLINAGQSCIAAKRFIVVEAIQERFEAAFVARMRAARVGDPLDETTDVGPLARVDLREQLDSQVQSSILKGARLLCGGRIIERPGAWYPPTVLAGVAPTMPAYEEELFGPVAALITARDEEDALAKANDSAYGLGAAVFTSDRRRGERLALEGLNAGSCFVNAFVRSDPRLPFGGIKDSGYGRELGIFGIREFVNIKTVYIA